MSESALPAFSESLPMALLQAREATIRRFRPVLARHDLTEQQWRVLRALDALDEAPEIGRLADATYLLPPSLSRILAHLDERSLIDRTAHATDQRRALISLTESGRRLVAEVAPESRAQYDVIADHLGAERLGRLLDDLHRLSTLPSNA